MYPKSTNWMPLCFSVKIEIFAPAEGIHLWAQLVVPGLPLWCFGDSWWNCRWWWESRWIWCPAKFKFRVQHWLGGQWLHGAVSVCSCKFKFEVETIPSCKFVRNGSFVSWWRQSKPCPRHNQIIVAVNSLCHLCGLWSQVFGLNGFGHCLWQNTSRLQHFAKDVFSVCGGKKAWFTVCICWWLEISMISPLVFFFLWSLLNTPSSSMGLIVDWSFLPWGQNTIMAPQRRTFYILIFGRQVFS